ncbi:hypothetical protein EXIGLDRAFT_767719 [Exidia glandulosa HHB12029]|uniref:Uncharacterized protein n=1 Tax=Exidia glandulosa HHB12029 TaxID=1314781 RepID=A0A165ITI4_EXIGL|nr:hypothetical protein EXIGLDRAFT_767719 [Exidia glandulosa HHB12029]
MPEVAQEIKSPEVRPWTGPFVNAQSQSTRVRGSTDSVNNAARSPNIRSSVKAQVESMEAQARERDRGFRARSKSGATRAQGQDAKEPPPPPPPVPEPHQQRPPPHRVQSFDTSAAGPEYRQSHPQTHARPTQHEQQRPPHLQRSTTVPPAHQPPPLARAHTIPRPRAPGAQSAFSDAEDAPPRSRLFTEMEAGIRPPTPGAGRSPRAAYTGMFASFAMPMPATTPAHAAYASTSSTTTHEEHPKRVSAVHIGPQPHTTSTARTAKQAPVREAERKDVEPEEKGRCSPEDSTDSSRASTPAKEDSPEPEINDSVKEDHGQASDAPPSVGGPSRDDKDGGQEEAPAGPGGDNLADQRDGDASFAPPPQADAQSSDLPPNAAPHSTKRGTEFKVAVESDSDTERESQPQPPTRERRPAMPQPSREFPASQRQNATVPGGQTSASTSRAPAASASTSGPAAGASSAHVHGLRHSSSRTADIPPPHASSSGAAQGLRHSSSRSGESPNGRQASNVKSSPQPAGSTPPPTASTSRHSPSMSKPTTPPTSTVLRDLSARRGKLREQMSELALELERVESAMNAEEERLRSEAERQRVAERERQRKAAEEREKAERAAAAAQSPPPPQQQQQRGKTPAPERSNSASSTEPRGYASEWESWEEDRSAWGRAQKKQEQERMRADMLRQWAAQAREKEERARRDEEARRRAEEEARKRAAEEEQQRRRTEESSKSARLSKLVVQGWDEYNAFWSNLNRGGDTPLRMATIRWPVIYLDPKLVASPELVLNLLTVQQIATFLLSPFHSHEKSHKERIRDALLRWHPDRFSGRFLNRVVENERPMVVQGLNVVTSILKGLLDRL